VEVVRIEWPSRLSNDLFDSRKKLTSFVEFDAPIDIVYKQMKYLPFIYLLEENSTI
jgi:hypothetical protein